MANSMLTNEDYNRFYLKLLADNTLVVFNALSPAETEIARRAKVYSERLDALARRADKASDADLPALNKDAFQAAQVARGFFILILDKKISEDFHLDLKATTINSFAKETEKYLDILDDFMNNRNPQYNPINEEVFWLLIFTNLCKNIENNLGNFQKRYRDKALEFSRTLNEYWSFSVELQGIISRVGDKYTRLADEHHVAVNEVLLELYEYMSTIIKLQRETRIPGSLSLLYLDRAHHMVCFYLQQWARFINAAAPSCDPFAPRISNT